MRYQLRIVFILVIVSVLMVYTYASANLAVSNNVTEAEQKRFDKGTLTALSMLRDKLGNEQSTLSLGAAGIKMYLTDNGVDTENFSLDIEAFLGQVALYALRSDDGFWDAYVWSNVDDNKMIELQRSLLLSYDYINELCTTNLYMFFGFTNNKNDNGYAVESSENAKQLYQLRFDQSNLMDSIKSQIPGLSNSEEEALYVFLSLMNSSAIPQTSAPIQSFRASIPNKDYIIYMLDISVDGSLNEKTAKSYFIIYDPTSTSISAISFDKVITHFDEIADKNTVYARYLTLDDGIGDYVINQLTMDKRVFGAYLKAFYDVYYK